jgi:hypothetical protein
LYLVTRKVKVGNAWERERVEDRRNGVLGKWERDREARKNIGRRSPKESVQRQE